MTGFEIVVEPNIRRRRVRRPLSDKKKAAVLFRMWHGMREMSEDAELLDDGELVHFLEVAKLLIEEKAQALSPDTKIFAAADTSRPN